MDGEQDIVVSNGVAAQADGVRRWTLRQKLLVAAVAAFLGIAVTAALLFFLRGNGFDPKRVEVSIAASAVSREIVSGEEVSFVVRVHNRNRVDMEEAELVVTFPPSVVQHDGVGGDRPLAPVNVSIGRIRSGEITQETFAARVIGGPETAQTIEAVVQYRPSSLSARFSSRSSQSFRIERAPITVTIDAPSRALSGERMTYAISYRLMDGLSLKVPRVVAAYPEGFRVESSNPAPVEGTDNQWDIARFPEGKIDVTGVMEGEVGREKRLAVSAGEWEVGKLLAQGIAEHILTIETNPLALTLDVQGSSGGAVNIGEALSYTIAFENRAVTAFRELIVRAVVEGAVVDARAVTAEGAALSVNPTAATWTAAGNSRLGLLAPGEKGMVTLRVPLRKTFPVGGPEQQNFVVKVTASIETPSAPEPFNAAFLRNSTISEVKVNTRLGLRSLALYRETSSAIINGGPHPPRAGETTAYTVHWRIVNPANAVDGVVVRSSLPPNVGWTGATDVTAASGVLRFNDRTREVIWDVGDVPAGTGVILPTYEAVFQVALTPSIQQQGTTPRILNDTSAEGLDRFTGVTLSASVPAISTSLPDDPSARGGGQVQ